MKIKLISFSVIILLIIMIFNSSVYASEYIQQGKDFLSEASREGEVIDEEKVRDTSNTIYNILLIIAIVLAIAVGMVIGIQFMLGSVEEQAKIKETLIPYLIGVFVVFSTFTIWKIAVGIGNKVAPTPGLTMKSIGSGNTYEIKCENCGRTFYRGKDEIDKEITCPGCGFKYSAK